jgi:drug/metabolite transporter (DMT)-like permease
MDLFHNPQALAALLASSSALLWGTGDFSGGLASQRSSPLSVMLVSTPLGLLVLGGAALVRHAPALTPHDALFAVLAGLCGAAGSLGLYQALSTGSMGVAAPLTAAAATLVALVFGAITEGLPGANRGAGFLLAILAVWVISRSPSGSGRANFRALLPALAAGVGFGLFFSFSAQFTAQDVGWAVVLARLSAFAAVVIVALIVRHPFRLERSSFKLALLAGTLDSLGNLSYALATQVGRLDIGAALSSLYPVATVGLAAVVLRERLTRWQGVGAVLALVSIPLLVG